MVTTNERFSRRARRTRYALRQLAGGKPRLSVFRSNRYIYAQVIDDVVGRTLASASSLEPSIKGDLASTSNRDAAKKVGLAVAERAKAAGVETVVFDRGGYRYHGRLAALAEGAREGGLTL
ncbi:MAG: 50S ribosomal protein L18 [Pseudomonadota bacterium]